MDVFFAQFKEAYGSRDGYALSMTLSPLDTQSQPSRLSSFFRTTNAASAVKDFKYRILYDNTNLFKLSQDEGNGWVDVYFAYWKVAGEILNAEAATKTNEKVSNPLHSHYLYTYAPHMGLQSWKQAGNGSVRSSQVVYDDKEPV
jgi:hypothetical protein